MNSIFASILRKIVRQLPPEARIDFGLGLVGQSSKEISLEELNKLISKLELLQLSVEDFERILKNPKAKVQNWENETSAFKLEYAIMDVQAPWLKMQPKHFNVPGMITGEEICYYHYIAQAYSGWGEIVELGPWLGHSTLHLTDAFSKNSNFKDKKLHVFDDFIWRSAWMDPLYSEANRPHNHNDFRFIFEKYAAEAMDKLIINHGKFANFDGNENLPFVTWENKPIEMIIVDCGRTLEANNGWYNIFSKNFVPNRTLIIMQDWRQHRERPRKFFNQTLEFSRRKPNLELIHEISDGGLATFLYR